MYIYRNGKIGQAFFPHKINTPEQYTEIVFKSLKQNLFARLFDLNLNLEILVALPWRMSRVTVQKKWEAK